MVSSTLTTDTWIKVSWSEFLSLAELEIYDKASFYYDQGRIRIEMSPLGWSHANQNGIIYSAISLYAGFKKLPIKGLTNCSFRLAGFSEFQPDLAFYIGEGLKIPTSTNSPVDLNEYSLPNLIVEIAATSLADDLGEKRLLYERLGITE
jgi:Uma2 family endonuclease